jgi:hypothetical protein
MNPLLNKKSMSDMVTVLIIISIAIVSVGIIWYTITSVINKQSNEIDLSSTCIGILLNIKSVEECPSGSNSCDVVVERRAGGGDIIGIKVIITDGLSNLIGNFDNTLKPLEMTTITATGSSLPENAKTASVAAIIQSNSGEAHICETSHTIKY